MIFIGRLTLATFALVVPALTTLACGSPEGSGGSTVSDNLSTEPVSEADWARVCSPNDSTRNRKERREWNPTFEQLEPLCTVHFQGNHGQRQKNLENNEGVVAGAECIAVHSRENKAAQDTCRDWNGPSGLGLSCLTKNGSRGSGTYIGTCGCGNDTGVTSNGRALCD